MGRFQKIILSNSLTHLPDKLFDGTCVDMVVDIPYSVRSIGDINQQVKYPTEKLTVTIAPHRECELGHLLQEQGISYTIRERKRKCL